MNNPDPECSYIVYKKFIKEFALSLDLSIDLWYNNNAGERTPTT